jgi:hypothetical protein
LLNSECDPRQESLRMESWQQTLPRDHPGLRRKRDLVQQMTGCVQLHPVFSNVHC